MLVVASLAIAGAVLLSVASVGAGLTAVDVADPADRAGYRIMAWFMGAVAGIIGIIGGLGLVGSLSAVVAERRREVGVLAAIGASPLRLASLLAGEAVASALLAWLGALALWPVISVPLGSQVGEALADVAIVPVYGPEFIGLLAGLLVMGLVAAAAPALSVSRLHVARSLGYE